MKIQRTLLEINADILQHREAIKSLELEVKAFRAACPHPDQFQKETYKSYDDEYGRLESTSKTTTCMLCGHEKYEDVPLDTRHR